MGDNAIDPEPVEAPHREIETGRGSPKPTEPRAVGAEPEIAGGIQARRQHPVASQSVDPGEPRVGAAAGIVELRKTKGKRGDQKRPVSLVDSLLLEVA